MKYQSGESGQVAKACFCIFKQNCANLHWKTSKNELSATKAPRSPMKIFTFLTLILLYYLNTSTLIAANCAIIPNDTSNSPIQWSFNIPSQPVLEQPQNNYYQGIISKSYTRNLSPKFKTKVIKMDANMKFTEDRNKILDGVEKINYSEASFGSFTYDRQSYFPIAMAGSNAVMIAGSYMYGKLFFSGHSDLLYNTQDSNFKLVRNIIQWMAGKKELYRVGLFLEADWSFLKIIDSMEEQNKVEKELILNSNQIGGQDIIIIPYYSSWPSSFSIQKLYALQRYVGKGGNLLFATHGWVWGAYGEGSTNKSLKYDENYAGLQISKLFNVYLHEDYYQLGNYQFTFGDSQKTEVSDFLKNDLLSVLKGDQEKFTVQDSQIEKYIKRIQQTTNFEELCSIDLYHELVDNFVGSRFDIEKHYQQIKFNDNFYNQVFKLMNELSYAIYPEECRALPPSLKYPGYPTSKQINKNVEVPKNRNKRIFVGLYMSPGEAIKIKHYHQFSDIIDVKVVINLNENLMGYDNGQLRRFPDIQRVFDMQIGEFVINSPHGGTIYFQVQSKKDVKPLKLQILGAYEAPYYNEALHSIADFQRIKKNFAPFFVFETNRFVISGRGQDVLRINPLNVSKITSFWNTVIDLYKNFSGLEPYPFEKDSVFCDTNIALGYMHSGYPIMTFEDVTYNLVGLEEDIVADGGWGIYHEIGHNHQDYKWTTSATGQVTNNIYSLYLFWKMQGVPVLKNKFFTDDTIKAFKAHLNLPWNKRYENYGKDPVIGIYLFAILIDSFGFQPFSKMQKNYNKLNPEFPDDVAKWDMLVEQLSIASNYNLWKYFRNWGIPVTKYSEQKVSKLNSYVCKLYPILTNPFLFL